MQATAMIYSLFGLVLGLGIADILRGFAEAWRTVVGVGPVKGDIRIGWLVPLLGALVIMDQTQFYIAAYMLRDAIPFTFFSLLCVLGVVGTYYLCSTFIFPDDPADWPDFDAYYLRTKRIVATGMLAANLALLGFAVMLDLTGHPLADDGKPSTALDMALSLVFMPLIAALIFARGKRANLVLLVLLNLTIIGGAVAPMVEAMG